MTGRAHRAAVTAVGITVLVWATVNGPARMLRTPRIGVGGSTRPQPSKLPAAAPSLRRPPPLPKVHAQQHRLVWVPDLLAWTALLIIILALLAGLFWLWRHFPRWRPPARPQEVRFAVLPAQELTDALEESAEKRAAAIEEGSPRNGVVACWLQLEQAVADAGLPPRPSETSTELTVRVLHALDIDPRPIASLAGLYREARFSAHPMTEDARRTARAAVERLNADLRAVAPPPAGGAL